MSAESRAPHEPTPTSEPRPVDAAPETTAPSGLRRVVAHIRDGAVRPFVIRSEFREDVIQNNADIITAGPTKDYDPATGFAKTHRLPKVRHTDTRPEPKAPEPKTIPQSGRERKYALDRALDIDELLEIKREKNHLESAYSSIGDREALRTEVQGRPLMARRAAMKAHRAYERLVHHEKKIMKKFGVDPDQVEAQRNNPTKPELTPEQKEAQERTASINTLAKLEGDVDALRREIHRKLRYLQSYSTGDLSVRSSVKTKEAELAKLTGELRAQREKLNRHIYTHLDKHAPEDVERQHDGSILVHGAKINNIPATWAVYEDGSAIQFADDGTTALARYRPNGVRVYTASKVPETTTTEEAAKTDFEAMPHPADITNMEAAIQELRKQIAEKRGKGEDATDEAKKLRVANIRLNMARYDQHLHRVDGKVSQPKEGIVVLHDPESIDDIWGEWILFENGAKICCDQNGDVIARFRADGNLHSMRSDPYAKIDTLPPPKPSGATLEEMNDELNTRQRVLNDTHKFIEANASNPALTDKVSESRELVRKTLASIRAIHEEYNLALYEQLRVSLPADAQVRRDGTIITDTTMNGYTGRWAIRPDGSSLYLGRNAKITDPDDDSQIKPLARFHRNGFRYM